MTSKIAFIFYFGKINFTHTIAQNNLSNHFLFLSKYSKTKDRNHKNSNNINYKNQIISRKINQALFKLKKYTISIYNNNYPFLLFGLLWFIGNKTGRYFSQKYIFDKPEGKLFIISELF